MPAISETFISPIVYKQKTSAIRSNGTALELDGSILGSAGDLCTTDVMTLLTEITQQACNLATHHNMHFSEQLPVFLDLIAQSMEVTDITTADSLESVEAVYT